MPWVSSEDVNMILGVAQSLDALGHRMGDSQELEGALRVAVDIAKGTVGHCWESLSRVRRTPASQNS